jgi:carbonic anhydrase
MKIEDKIIKELKTGNKNYSKINTNILKKFIKKQSPKIAVLTCSDSRVIPEYIFNKSIGQLFVIRVAGNIAIDPTVIQSIEYAVDHLKISHFIILGHTNCGAIKASEESNDDNVVLFNEIKESFHLDNNNHFKANILRQLEMIPKRSDTINKNIKNKNLKLIGALYHIEDGLVEFITD